MALDNQLFDALSAIRDRLRGEALWVKLWFIRQSDAFSNDVRNRSWVQIYNKTAFIQIVSMVLTAAFNRVGRAAAQAENGSGGGGAGGGDAGGTTTACDNEFFQWLVFFAITTVLTGLIVAALVATGIGGAKRAVSPSQGRREEGARQQISAVYAVGSTAVIYVFVAVFVQQMPFNIVTSCIPTL
jgi:hypothetical protein